MMKPLFPLCIFFLLSLCTLHAQQRPNIVLILADDMGYSDLGCFGAEIQTPNLDKMAKEGIKMTNFYNASRCCPSRASLLTGLYPHQAGVGDMMNKRPFPTYQGFLNRHSVTLAELLKSAGYGTYMAGKWHVGQEKENWPLQRGFQRYYGLIDGANSYFENRPYRPNQTLTIALDNEAIVPPKDYYSSDAYTDYAMTFIGEHLEAKKEDPFFLYLAFQAPHWPLHAKPQDIAKYRGKYMEGWEVIRKKRFQKQQQLGLLPPTTKLSPVDTALRKWNDCSWEEKVKWDEKMAVYAAMVDELDQNVGRLVDYLQSKGQLENTVFIFLSDNGASNETISNAGFTAEIRAANELPASHPRSFTAYGIEGAAVSNTPFKKFKHWEFEGGNATGFIAYGPKFLQGGRQFDMPAHLIDIMPTLAQWSGASYPNNYAGHTIKPMEGMSLLPLWTAQQQDNDREICFEHEGNKAVRKGKWKLVSSYPENKWYLYDIEKDRSETVDLSTSSPKIYSEMVQIYENWAKRVGVISYEQLVQKKESNRDE